MQAKTNNPIDWYIGAPILDPKKTIESDTAMLGSANPIKQDFSTIVENMPPCRTTINDTGNTTTITQIDVNEASSREFPVDSNMLIMDSPEDNPLKSQ